ncbi:MAG TPA: polymer-forming cytoskeletal protein [Levilinea sp.]|nr:polymer-forming cytoskeletal protein [Levilinea sp.]
MKSICRYSVIWLLVLVLLAFPSQALAQSPRGDQVVFGGHFTLRDGEILDGNLAVFGGSADLEEGSRVNGSIAVMGGSVDIDGEVRGSINVIGGSVFLGDTAHVFGDILTVGGNVTRQPGARVDGSARRTEPDDFQLPQIVRPGLFLPSYDINLAPIGNMLWFIFRTLAISALAVLVVLFMTTPTQRAAKTMITQPLISGVMGFLTLVVAPALAILLAVTIILIPLSLLGFLALFVALIYGWIVVGVEVGDRLAAMFRTSWTMPVSAGLGTLVLTVVAGAVGQIPCIGWVLSFVVAMVGLGSVVLSRFGTQTYLGQASAHPSSPGAPFSSGNALQPSPREHDLSVAAPKAAAEPVQKLKPPEEPLPG